MIATPDWLIDVAASLGIVAGLLTAFGVILKSPCGRVVRWVWLQLVGAPITAWAQRAIHATVSPQIEQLRKENAAQHKQAQLERSEQMVLLVERLEVVDRLAGIHEERITALENDRR